MEGEKGACNSGRHLKVSDHLPHFGEETPLVGNKGSGTIFLSHCNLKCVYCQNYRISQDGEGTTTTSGQLADMMIELQENGCHNINLVSPTHYAPQLIEALNYAIEKGLHIPLVWNSGGYESVDTLKLLSGIVDIYLPDIKYGSNEAGQRYSNAPGYFDVCKDALFEMYGQVGDLKMKRGIAYRGMIIRHLVLPNNCAASENVLPFLASMSKNSYVNIMGQYRPYADAFKFEELKRCPTRYEISKIHKIARNLGLVRGFQKTWNSSLPH